MILPWKIVSREMNDDLIMIFKGLKRLEVTTDKPRLELVLRYILEITSPNEKDVKRCIEMMKKYIGE